MREVKNAKTTVSNHLLSRIVIQLYFWGFLGSLLVKRSASASNHRIPGDQVFATSVIKSHLFRERFGARGQLVQRMEH